MEIALHIGANCTDDNRLLRSLLKNAESLKKEGVKIPSPRKYRIVLRETVQNLAGTLPEEGTRDSLLQSMGAAPSTRRLVLSHPALMCVANRVFEGGEFYALADAKIASLSQLFKNDDLTIYMALRNPATFVPTAFAESKAKTLKDFLHNIPLENILWAPLLERLRRKAPNAKFVIWCNEDTPLIWSNIIRVILDVSATTRILGGYDLLAAIMKQDGMSRMSSYLKSSPPKTEIQRRKIMATFLERYAIEEELVQEFDHPEWTQDVIDGLTNMYDQDVAQIEAMDGITFIAP